MNAIPIETCTQRAAIYARVSSEQQTQHGTVKSQLADLRQRVEADGLRIDEELCFIDDGYSGSTLVRPALDRLRDVAHGGGFERLYVHSPDRLARKYAWQVLLVEELQHSGVELTFLNRTIGAGPEEDLLLQVQGMIAEYERTKIMERSRRGKRHAARRGSVNALCGAPYGYRYIGKHEGGGQAHYQVKLEEARIVQQIFEWIGRDRMSIRAVCRRLAEQGIASAKGKRWCPETVSKLLRNPAYKGQAVFGKTRVGERRPPLRPGRGRPEHPRHAVSRYAGTPEDQIVIPVPAIIGEELSDAVGEQLAENRKRARQQKGGAGYLLQGLIECGCCGYSWYGKGITRFTRNDKAPYAYYRCVGMDGYRFGGQPVCTNKPVRLDRLDAAVWSDVCVVIQNPDDLRREFERRLNGGNEPDVNLIQTNKQIAAVRRSISRLIDAYEDGLLNKDEFEPRLRQARQRLHRLQQDATAASDRAAQQAELRLVLDHLDQFAEQVRAGLDQADQDTRRQIIRALVRVVKIEDNHVRIIYRISPRPFAEGRSGGPIRQHCQRRVQRGMRRLAVGAGPQLLFGHRGDQHLAGHRLGSLPQHLRRGIEGAEPLGFAVELRILLRHRLRIRLGLGVTAQALGALDVDALAGRGVRGVPALLAVGTVDSNRHEPVADLGGVGAANFHVIFFHRGSPRGFEPPHAAHSYAACVPLERHRFAPESLDELVAKYEKNRRDRGTPTDSNQVHRLEMALLERVVDRPTFQRSNKAFETVRGDSWYARLRLVRAASSCGSVAEARALIKELARQALDGQYSWYWDYSTVDLLTLLAELDADSAMRVLEDAADRSVTEHPQFLGFDFVRAVINVLFAAGHVDKAKAAFAVFASYLDDLMKPYPSPRADWEATLRLG